MKRLLDMLPLGAPLLLLVLLAFRPEGLLPQSLLVALVCLVCGLALAFIPFFQSLIERLRTCATWRWQLGLFFFAALSQAAVALWVFEREPGTADAESMWFQARLFADGRILIPDSPPKGLFHMFAILGQDTGVPQWCSMYPPGWPALWVPAVWAGMPWLVNPLIGGLLAIMIYRLGRDLIDEDVGRLASAMSLASPLVLLLGGTWYSHHPTALFMMLCFWGTARLMRGDGDRFGWAAGLGFALGLLVRPTTAIALGGCFGLGVLVQWRGALNAWRGVLIAGALAGLGMVLLLAYYQGITGDPFTPGHEIGVPEVQVGFDEVNHTPADGFDDTLERVSVINRVSLGWPLPALLLVFLGMLRGHRWLGLWLLLPALLLLGMHATMSYYEVYFPGRYLFSALPGLLVLAASGLLLFRRWPGSQRWVVGTCMGCAFYGFAAGIPGTLGSYDSFFKGLTPDLAALESEYGLDGALVLMQDGWDGIYPAGNGVYQYGFRRNAIDLDGPVVYVRNRYPKNAVAYRMFPGRDVYLFVWHEATRRGELFRVYPERGEDMVRLTPKIPESMPPRWYEKTRRDPLELVVPEGATQLELTALTHSTNSIAWTLFANDKVVAEGQGEEIAASLSDLPPEPLTLRLEPGGLIGLDLKWTP